MYHLFQMFPYADRHLESSKPIWNLNRPGAQQLKDRTTLTLTIYKPSEEWPTPLQVATTVRLNTTEWPRAQGSARQRPAIHLWHPVLKKELYVRSLWYLLSEPALVDAQAGCCGHSFWYLQSGHFDWTKGSKFAPHAWSLCMIFLLKYTDPLRITSGEAMSRNISSMVVVSAFPWWCWGWRGIYERRAKALYTHRRFVNYIHTYISLTLDWTSLIDSRRIASRRSSVATDMLNVPLWQASYLRRPLRISPDWRACQKPRKEHRPLRHVLFCSSQVQVDPYTNGAIQRPWSSKAWCMWNRIPR